MTGLERAVLALQQALEAPRREPSWRGLVRHRLAGVREVLDRDSTGEGSRGDDAWLTAREDVLDRELAALLSRLRVLSALVQHEADLEDLRGRLLRLVADLERHGRRLNDLVYDSVSLELGGSG